MSNNENQVLLIIDFGSQYTHLIGRRLRYLRTYCEIHPYEKVTLAFIKTLSPQAIILSGGPKSVLDKNCPSLPKAIFSLGIPILGICYGQQLMISLLGGKVEKGVATAEFGRAFITPTGKKTDFLIGCFVNGSEEVWMSHGDHVSENAEGFEVFAKSSSAPFAITADLSRKLFGVQFHPEVQHTVNGTKVYENFLKIANFKRDWTMGSYMLEAIQAIRTQVGNEKVICGLSGGVDSSVTALLLHRAIGNNLTCVFVDNGLLRKGESKQVIKMFKDKYQIPLIHVNKKKIFMKTLKGTTNPEKKRKIIGKLFVKVFEKVAESLGDVKFLAQGTLYPDIIESVSVSGAPSEKIKSHHNVGGLPKKMRLKLVEPLRALFKDEVRLLGRELALPNDFVERHPFPGPGLAIRCIGKINAQKLKILRHADHIFISQIKKFNLYDEIWQAFVVILPVRSVGVMGDKRTYDYTCVLRAVTSVDGMTADYYPFKHSFLSQTATKIINEVRGVNRVTYDITSKPPGTIEWE